MKDSYKLIIGIDPGKGGGMAILEEKDKSYMAMKFPKELEDLSPVLESFISQYKNSEIYVMIEHVHSFTTDSRPEAFSFGVTRNSANKFGIGVEMSEAYGLKEFLKFYLQELYIYRFSKNKEIRNS